ncbi:MAG: LPS assembly lipoprotein LptE [Desulfonatronovibrionaceae bacterium]
MYRFSLYLLLLLACVLSGVGCGYHFSSTSPITIPRDQSRLYLSRVDNPTQQGWLSPYVRSTLRDELARRGQVSWVDRDQAETLVRVEVRDFSSSDSVKAEEDKSVKFSARITLRVLMSNATDGSPLWNSGWVSGSESFYAEGEKRTAGQKAVDEALRRAADGLGKQF